MKTVNSLSGGKTSSFLEKHYPADLSLFALVCIDDHNANAGSTTFKIDKHVRQIVNDRLQKFCANQPEFLGTAEDPIIIRTMLELEQHTGREIIWLRGIGFQNLAADRKMMPNKTHRFCTTEMKIEPIFNFLFKYHELPVKMRIGYRADEAERVNKFKDTFIYATHCERHIDDDGNFFDKNQGIIEYPIVPGIGYTYAHRWQEIPFRIGEFPLIEDGIVKADIQKYWAKYNVPFAVDSNCQFCFWKHPQTLRRNFDTQPATMASAIVMETMHNGARLHQNFSMQQIRDHVKIQTDLFQTRGGSCHGGYCTD